MRAYLIRRFLLIFPTLFILTLMVFLTVRFLPGNVLDMMLIDVTYIAEMKDIEEIKHRLGLDVPVYVQYGRWIGVLPTPDPVSSEYRFNGLLQGTFGESLFGVYNIEQKILSKLAVTLELGLLSIVIMFLISLPVGIYSAIRQDTVADYAGRSFAIAGLSVPDFWLGIMVVTYPAIWWRWTPSLELIPFMEDPLGNLRMFLIPAVILGTGAAAGTMRYTRTMMLEVLRQDYIRTAWSKGLSERVVIMRHAFRNTLIPIVTATGMILPVLVGGSVIMENIFSLPGLGQMALEALRQRDYPVVQAMNLFYAVLVMTNILIIDISYAWLDPRVRYS